MAKKKLYICGRCGYRSHYRMKCHSCGFMLEEECGKCYNAKGNCVCRFHGVFGSGKKTRRKAAAAVRKKRSKAKKRKQ
ncbi:hypothetical protein HYU40_03660 [Candidatus Woesearchaeota archaeon]|nr:hypothetical protein [Candidatus Woesearchaeota archaeon]